MNWISRRIGEWTSWLFVAGVIVTVYEVVLRYVFARPTIWAQELTILISAAAFVVGGLYSLERREHIAITIFSDRMRGGLKWSVELLGTILGIVFLAAVVWGGRREAWEALTQWQTTATAFDSPTPAILKPLIVAIAAAMILQLIVNLVRKAGK